MYTLGYGFAFACYRRLTNRNPIHRAFPMCDGCLYDFQCLNPHPEK